MENFEDKGKHNYGLGFWKKKETRDHFDYLLKGQFIKTYVMSDEQFVQKHSFKYDYIHLDGDHRYFGAKKSFELFWPRLKEKGYISFHDIHFEAESKGIKFEQWKLWEELIKKHGYKMEFSNDYSGIGIIQKITKKRKRFKKKFD